MQNATSAAPNQRAGRREWLGLAVLGVATLLVAFDSGVLFLALPHLSADLGATSSQQLWIIDIYLFLLAGVLITMGTLGDRIGRRRLLLVGAGGFTVASAISAYSTSPEMLIAARALLGVAAATMSPSTLALISNMFRDARQRGVAISVWATCMFAGGATGPVIGGVMLNYWWWGSVFLLAVPVMAVLLVAGPLLLPEYRNPEAVGRIDLASVALSLAAILPIIYGIKNLATSDGNLPVAVGAIVAGLAITYLFVRRQLRLPNPLLDLRLLRQRKIRVVLPAMLIGSGAFAGTSLFTAQYIQSVAGRSPGESGLWMAFTGLGIAAGTLLAPVLVRGLQPRSVIILGLTGSAIALLVLTQAGTSGWLIGVVASIAVVAFGIGPLFALGTGIMVGSAPPERAGAAASMSETSNLFGTSLGLALLGSAGAAVYRGQMADADLGAYPPELADSARETIGAATVGGDPGLIALARDAFTSGLNVVAAISAVFLVALIVVIIVTFRGDGADGSDAAEPAEPADEAGSGAQPASTR
ncbi:MFS transporter [Micromonospora peucetia]|uniref:MFS transporter n=1 Tax=Micromonospora peucetia TaxID=47871 RepID=A0A1C6VUU5_9ACTN|nr:MFS transporter [Micromonospora peucetia]WSA31233.1 MFS transporter [Micromonospora peucetia]SCL70129.1 MFS transporter, DHA2 family, multidrug resistance protein [Micromonospora peucetia]